MNRPAKIFFTVFALALSLAGMARAQDRWLFIFENSAAMKKRMPAVNEELQRLLFTSISGKLHGGDSLGVWSFDQKLHVGEFPLRTWQPETAVNTYSNLSKFLAQRSYKGAADFNALEPVLSEVVAGSQRLTVLIFCEGTGEIIWTPYNSGINQALKAGYDERKKSAQPFVIVLRVQDGKYFGCSVNFPPGELSLPAFPEPVVEPAPAPVVTNIVTEPEKKRPPLDTTPLFVVGTNSGTNLAQLPPLPPKTAIVATNPPPPVTNNPPVAATNQAMATTNPPAAAITNPVASGVTTTAPPATDNSYRLLIVTGALAFISAVSLVVFLVVRARQPQGSLITDSLNSSRYPTSKK